MDTYWEQFPYGVQPVNEKQRDELRGNLLILYRELSSLIVMVTDISPYIGKLREGLLSAKRTDSFALQGCIASLWHG